MKTGAFFVLLAITCVSHAQPVAPIIDLLGKNDIRINKIVALNETAFMIGGRYDGILELGGVTLPYRENGNYFVATFENGKLKQVVLVEGDLVDVTAGHYFVTRNFWFDEDKSIQKFAMNNQLQWKYNFPVLDSSSSFYTSDALTDRDGNTYLLSSLGKINRWLIIDGVEQISKNAKVLPRVVLGSDTITGPTQIIQKFDNKGTLVGYRLLSNHDHRYRYLRFTDNYISASTANTDSRKGSVVMTLDLKREITDTRIKQRGLFDSGLNGYSYRVTRDFAPSRSLNLEQYDHKDDLFRRREIYVDTSTSTSDRTFSKVFDVDNKKVVVAYATFKDLYGSEDLGAELHLVTVSKKDMKILKRRTISTDQRSLFDEESLLMELIGGHLVFGNTYRNHCTINEIKFGAPDDRSRKMAVFLARIKVD